MSTNSFTPKFPRRHIALLTSLLCLTTNTLNVSAISSNQGNSSTQSEMIGSTIMYVDPLYHYQMTVPADWNIYPTPSDALFGAALFTNYDAPWISSGQANKSDEALPSHAVKIQIGVAPSAGQSLDQWTANWLAAESINDQIKQSSFTAPTRMSVGQMAGYSRVLDVANGRKTQEIVLMGNSEQVVVVGITSASPYYNDAALGILATLRLNPKLSFAKEVLAMAQSSASLNKSMNVNSAANVDKSPAVTEALCPVGTFPGTEAPNSPIALDMPFSAGETWMVGGVGYFYGNGDHCNSFNDYYATDWNMPGAGNGDSGKTVLPVAGGTIVAVVVPTCPTTGYGCEVQIDHDGGIRTRYAHLGGVNRISGSVSHSDQIGSVGSTGNSTYAHLHLGFRKNDGGFYSHCYNNGQTCPNSEAASSPQSPKPSPMRTANGTQELLDGATYVGGSSGGGSDTTAPTASWVSPSNGQTISSRTVNLQVNASDNSGSVSRVDLNAKFNSQWVTVARFTSPPYSSTWDMCNSGVPDGDIELGLEAWDNAGNHFVYSDWLPNYHINKSYNCNPTPKPSANFDAWPQSGTAPLSVAMHIVSTAHISSCLWDYGDGQTGNFCASSHNHTYSNAGSYTVKLTVSGPGGNDSMTRSGYIVVTNPNNPPTVSWVSPSNGQTISARSINLQASTTGGTGGISRVSFSAKYGGTWHGVADVYASPYNYTWDMCNASVPDGDIELGLEVWDNTNNHYVYSEHYSNYHINKSYNCNPTPKPSANFDAWPQSGTAPLNVAVHIVSTANISSCSWDYGDGQTGNSCASSHNHTYSSAGSYTVKLTVSGPGGNDSMTRSGYIVVSNQNNPPTVSWVSPNNGQTISARSVNLQANTTGGTGGISRVSISAKYGGTWRGVADLYSAPYNYAWDLCVASVPDGDIELGLEVWDNANNHYVYSEHYTNYHITKSYNCNPTPKPSANFDAWPQTGNAPLTVAMHIVSTANMNSCSWDYGDGQSGNSCSDLHNHTYASAGTYSVKLTVNGSGGSDSMTRNAYIVVQNPSTPPTVSWINLINGQTISAQTLSLQARTSGGTGGINNVAMSAKWGGTWHGISTLTSAPYDFTWDLCNSGVPDGDIELGLEVWDNANNHYVHSEHYTNYHITKSFNCNPNPKPSANFDAWPQYGDAPLVVAIHIVSTAYLSSCQWDYGDGQTGNSCSDLHNHVYTSPGIYTVKLTVSGTGGSDTMTRNAYIYVNSAATATPIPTPMPCTGCGLANTQWPTFQQNNAHTGRSSFVGPQEPRTRWAKIHDAFFTSSPIIGSNNRIYSTGANQLYALDATTGEELWSFQGNGNLRTPALATNGRLYLTSDAGTLYCIRESGELIWETKISDAWTNQGVTIAPDGTIYLGSSDGWLYAFNPDGTLKWQRWIGSWINGIPALDSQGNIYVGSSTHSVYALRPNGDFIWTFETDDFVDASPVIDEDRGVLYIGSVGGTFYALNQTTGERLWSYAAGGAIYRAAAIDTNGHIYFGSTNGNFYMMSPAGNVLTIVPLNDLINDMPTIDARNTIYVGTENGTLYALKSDGNLLWQYSIPGHVSYGSSIGSDALYVGTSYGIYTLEETPIEPVATQSPSPIPTASPTPRMTVTPSATPLLTPTPVKTPSPTAISARNVISGRVFRDLNGNGQQDNGEPQIVGATINLYSQPFFAAQVTGASPIATTMTDSSGAYRFANVEAGGYQVEILPTNGVTRPIVFNVVMPSSGEPPKVPDVGMSSKSWVYMPLLKR